jgi:LysR family transcriptional regulator, glycine cleavage system transcriptional activator
MRALPSLSALFAFEAAARHRSFKQAAVELHVTPTAVSHQIRALEGTLGVRLFSRKVRRVELTHWGELLLPTLSESFDAIAHAVGVVTRPSRREIVVLSATTAFTAKWLIPRLGRSPVALRLQATEEVLDLAPGVVDLAIRYGRGPYPHLDATPLVEDRFAPVASPRLRVRRWSDLARHPRLEFDWHKSDAATPTWSRWSRQAGLRTKLRASAEFRFSDESHAIQAAVAGHGVALISLSLVSEELRAKLLEIPFGPVIEGPTYHLVHSLGRPLSPAASTVKAWLLEEARTTREQLAQPNGRA